MIVKKQLQLHMDRQNVQIRRARGELHCMKYYMSSIIWADSYSTWEITPVHLVREKNQLYPQFARLDHAYPVFK